MLRRPPGVTLFPYDALFRSLLFKELKRIARQNSWPYVRWITATDNHRARAVYDKISETIDFVTYQMPSH